MLTPGLSSRLLVEIVLPLFAMTWLTATAMERIRISRKYGLPVVML
jgi:hypothetical protein